MDVAQPLASSGRGAATCLLLGAATCSWAAARDGDVDTLLALSPEAGWACTDEARLVPRSVVRRRWAKAPPCGEFPRRLPPRATTIDRGCWLDLPTQTIALPGHWQPAVARVAGSCARPRVAKAAACEGLQRHSDGGVV